MLCSWPPPGVHDASLISGSLTVSRSTRAYPKTFEIPPRSQRESLRAGDLATLLFEVVHPTGDDPGAERMWVMVQQDIGGRYVGTLDNVPQAITTIAADDPVEFGPEHVIQIWQDQ